MNIKHTLAALTLITAGTLSTQVNAQEVNGVEQIVSNFLGNAMGTMSVEIDNQVQKITLSASNVMSFDSPAEVKGNVTITDLASTEKAGVNDTSKTVQEDSPKESTTDE